MVRCSAPGKVILFGEHAVVYGEPAIAIAVDRRVESTIESSSSETSVNGYKIEEDRHKYIYQCIQESGIEDHLEIVCESEIPSGAGMGSSAAVTVSIMAALDGVKGVDLDRYELARRAFDIEWKVQGSASPIDTSTAVHGNAIKLSKKKEKDFLWDVKKNENEWYVHHLDIPDMHLVVGDTGVHAPTGPLVQKVRRFYEKSNFAKEIIEDIGALVEEGCKAVERGDVEKIGRLMKEDQKLLSILGVSHPRLEALIKAAGRFSYGAKLTGAGGGGAMVALTDEPEKVAEAIKKRGGTPYIIEATKEGVKKEK
ncbi:MAG: mevalonate kinase [Thermoplasmatota archaeon]